MRPPAVPTVRLKRNWYHALVVRADHVRGLIAIAEGYAGSISVELQTRDKVAVRYDEGEFDFDHRLNREITSLELSSEADRRSVALTLRAPDGVLSGSPGVKLRMETASLALTGPQDDVERVLALVEREIDDMKPWYLPLFAGYHLDLLFLILAVGAIMTMILLAMQDKVSWLAATGTICLALGFVLRPLISVVLPACSFAVGPGAKKYDNRLKQAGTIIAAYVAIAVLAIGLVASV